MARVGGRSTPVTREEFLSETVNLLVADVLRLEGELRRARVAERKARAELGALQAAARAAASLPPASGEGE